MSATIIACCISALFGAWIYFLKAQIECLEGQVADTVFGAGAKEKHNTHPPQTNPRAQANHARSETESTGSIHRSTGGIPTWTIECS